MKKKSAKRPFLLSKPRLSTNVRCDCHADAELFLPWEKLSTAAKREFSKNGPIPCEGGGMPGEWCVGCRFGVIFSPETIESDGD